MVSLVKLDSIVGKCSDCNFFKTKSFILNCDKIVFLVSLNRAYGSHNYQYFAKMSNGDSIKVSKEKYRVLKQRMTELSL